jgi:hypothetical protein
MAKQRLLKEGLGFVGLTGCDRIRAMVNALTKHMTPVGGPGGVMNALQLTQRRLAAGNKIPANTSGVSTKDSLHKSFIENDVLHEYTDQVHHTTVSQGKITGSQQIGGPSLMKFDLRKKGHYTGFKPL